MDSDLTRLRDRLNACADDPAHDVMELHRLPGAILQGTPASDRRHDQYISRHEDIKEDNQDE